jgi:hypothetical protein
MAKSAWPRWLVSEGFLHVGKIAIGTYPTPGRVAEAAFRVKERYSISPTSWRDWSSTPSAVRNAMQR